MEKEETFQNIKKQIIEILKEAKAEKYTPDLCPEIMGKINVFGSIDEISRLSKETGCDLCIDFAHVLARYKVHKFEEIKETFGKLKNWHIHFSGIEYGEKGEKKHVKTSEKEWAELFKNLPKDKDLTIISESPNPVDDAVLAIKTLGK